MKVEEDWEEEQEENEMDLYEEEDEEEIEKIEDEVDEICRRVTCEDCPSEICGDFCEILCEEQDLEEEVE